MIYFAIFLWLSICFLFDFVCKRMRSYWFFCAMLLNCHCYCFPSLFHVLTWNLRTTTLSLSVVPLDTHASYEQVHRLSLSTNPVLQPFLLSFCYCSFHCVFLCSVCCCRRKCVRSLIRHRFLYRLLESRAK